jgi:hypothetical protein
VFNVDLLLTGSATQGIGLAFLANAALLSRPRRAIEDAFDDKPTTLAGCQDTERRKIHSLFGFGFLFAGFGLNFAGFAAPTSPPTAWLGALLGLVGLLAAAAAVGSSRLALSTFKRHLRDFFQQRRDWPFERQLDLTMEIGEVFGIPRSEADTVEEYVAKVRRTLGVPEDSARAVRGARPIPTPVRPTAVGF